MNGRTEGQDWEVALKQGKVKLKFTWLKKNYKNTQSMEQGVCVLVLVCLFVLVSLCSFSCCFLSSLANYETCLKDPLSLSARRIQKTFFNHAAEMNPVATR